MVSVISLQERNRILNVRFFGTLRFSEDFDVIHTKGAFLGRGEKFYSCFNEIFHAIDNDQLKYNWLVTNCECYLSDREMQDLFDQDYAWISGEDLTRLVEKENPQFIWGIFSAFPKQISPDDVLEYELPDAESPSYMQDHVPIQHPLAEIEIGAFDSSYTTFICRDDCLTNKFMAHFPLAEDLDEMNTQNNAAIGRIERLLRRELKRRHLNATDELLNGKFACWHRLGEQRRTIANEEEISEQISNFFENKKA